MTESEEQGGDGAPRLGVRERKAHATRRRLLATALDVIAREGIEAVTVRTVADGSDIATGTFYNYFTSAEELIDTIVDLEIGTMGRRLDALSTGISDPADELSATLRHLVRAAITDPTWGWLIVRLGAESERVSDLIGGRIARTIERGAHAGRFIVKDVPTATAMTLGALVAATRVFLDGSRALGEAEALFVENQLRALGITAAEAERTANRRLPDLPVIADQGALSIVRIAL
ncbi:MAG: TetR/AcrR family transcriptional regulator [Microbacteriaceae bacterium]|nr:TetR/AcrR family transcriptional regulator [Microbacteriaceae bacterium]